MDKTDKTDKTDKKQNVKLADGAQNLERTNTPAEYASEQAKKLNQSSTGSSVL